MAVQDTFDGTAWLSNWIHMGGAVGIGDTVTLSFPLDRAEPNSRAHRLHGLLYTGTQSPERRDAIRHAALDLLWPNDRKEEHGQRS